MKMYYIHMLIYNLIKRINIYVNIYSFNQTIVSCKVYTPRFHKMFGHGNLV